MSPEDLISNYLLKFQDLYANTTFLDSAYPQEMKQVNKDFERAISRLKLLSIVHDKYVIAVSGFQGAGKTTLLNWFLFDDPSHSQERWLPENQAIGENLPVLVTCERGREDVEAILYEVQKNVDHKRSDDGKNSITKTYLQTPQLTQETVRNPRNSDLLVELMVPMPETLLENTDVSILDGTSFLLLPGYEVINDGMDENKIYRQEYMRMALKACATSMIVLDPRTVMQQEKEEALKEMTSIFEGTDALYVLSHLDVDESEGLSASNYLQQDLNVREGRIIHTGTLTDKLTRSLVDKWRIELVEKISTTVSSKQKLRSHQKSNIEDLIFDCDLIIEDIRELKDKIEIGNMEETYQIRKLFELYDEAVDSIRRKYLDIYDKRIKVVAEEAFDKLEKEKYDSGQFKKIKDWFKYKWKGPEPISSIADIFENTFNEELENLGGAETLLFSVLNETQNKLGVYSDLLVEGDQADLKQDALINNVPQHNYQLNEGVIRNIQFIGGSENIHSKELKSVDPNKDLARAMELIPLIVFDSQRFQLVSDGKAFLDIFRDKEDAPASDSFMDNFGDLKLQTKSFITGIAALVGGDLLPDGELDNIGGLFAALFGKSAENGAAVSGAEVAAAGSTSVLGVTTGIAVGLVILQSLNNAAIQHGLKKVSALYEIKNYQIDRLKSLIREDFDSTFSRVRNIIEYRIKEYAHNDYNVGYAIKLENRVKSCEAAGTELKSTLREAV